MTENGDARGLGRLRPKPRPGEVDLLRQELGRVKDELERVNRELRIRKHVTTAMLGTLDLEQVLYVILSGITCGDGLGFNRAFLFLEEESGRSIRVVMALGPADEEAAHTTWEQLTQEDMTLEKLLLRYETYRNDPSAHQLTRLMGAFSLPCEALERLAVPNHTLYAEHEMDLLSVLAHCLVRRSPFASNSLTLHHTLPPPDGQALRFERLALVPVHVDNRLLGAFLADNLYTSAQVNTEDLNLLESLGNLAALAIDRARLHAKTVAMAEVDGLTGVYNRRYYEEELGRILEKGRRSGQPLSIVVFDLDHFKVTNDTYGHLTGDEVLKQVARLLTSNVRSTDKVARYGGEEFVLLLRDTTLEEATLVANKLCQIVKAAPCPGTMRGPITLSAGVASTRGRLTAKDLFARADQALYQAKAAGRDRVVAWSHA